MNNPPGINVNPRKRPVVVWLGTIYAGIFAGILPFATSVFILFVYEHITLLDVLISLVISGGVIISAIFTWKGNNTARIIFLVFVSLYYVMVGINNLLMYIAGGLLTEEQIRVFSRVLRGVIFPAIYIYYFTRPNVLIYFKPRDEDAIAPLE